MTASTRKTALTRKTAEPGSKKRIPCEFFLIRYVHDVVKGEFINIGVLLREVRDPDAETPHELSPPRLRFTRDWKRVHCMHADADTNLFEDLEAEMLHRLQTDPKDPATYPKPILDALTDSMSNSIQISEPRASLAENLTTELDLLMRLYVEPLPQTRTESRSDSDSDPMRTGRVSLQAAMRSAFEKAGVWSHMRKRIPVSKYTRTGDPMRLDCAYRPNGVIRVFHAISLESSVDAAKSLALSAPLLRDGFQRIDAADLDLAAVVEPIRVISRPSRPAASENDFSDEAAELYRFGVETMESAGIRVLTTNNLIAAAEHARLELRL